MSAVEKILNGEKVNSADFTTGILKDLQSCEQTRKHHQEGNVLNHTLMVLEKIETILKTTGKNLNDEEKTTLSLAGLLHDIGKVKTTEKTTEGTYHSKNHAEVGASMVTKLFMETPILQKQSLSLYAGVHALVRNHMWHWYMDQVSLSSKMRANQLAAGKLHYLLWEADIQGRLCTDKQNLQTQVEYAKLLLEEDNLWEKGNYGILQPLADNLNPHVLQSTFRKMITTQNNNLNTLEAWAKKVEKTTKSSITYTIGLPGSGKSQWSKKWQEETNGIVLSAAGKRKKDRINMQGKNLQQLPLLLAKNTPVLIDATHCSRQSRDIILNYGLKYNSEITTVLFSPPLQTILKRQSTRPISDSVPEKAIMKMIENFRFPTPDEYSKLILVNN